MENTWIVVKGNCMVCERCGKEEYIKIPIELEKFTKTLYRFEKEHKNC